MYMQDGIIIIAYMYIIHTHTYTLATNLEETKNVVW